MAAKLFEDYKTALEKHIKSPEYRANLKDKRKKLWVPDFCEHASAKATILAIFQDPGKSDPEKKTGRCSLHTNTDATANNQKKILEKAGIDWENDHRIVFWNFYGAIGSFNNAIDGDWDKRFWAERMGELISKLKHLKIIVACGNHAWMGMRYYCPENDRFIPLVFSTHSSRQALNNKGWETAIEAWRLAKRVALD